MVWKMWTPESPTYVPEIKKAVPKKRQKGQCIISIPNSGKLSVEDVTSINPEIAGFNLSTNRVLLKAPKNDTQFDQYVALPFTKGVTERETGRTLMILGTKLHHIEAMKYQFDGVLWTKDDGKELVSYGNTIRWINVGSTKGGFIGIDYDPKAKKTAGVATNTRDVKFLAETLLSVGYDPKKRLYILKPPYINERLEGWMLRQSNIATLEDFAKKNFTI